MESLPENRFNDIASAAIFQHERRFTLPLSELEGTIHNAKWRHGPPVGNHWPRPMQPPRFRHLWALRKT